MNTRPSELSMLPQDGVGGGTPYPMKLRLASATTAVPMFMVASDEETTGITFGII